MITVIDPIGSLRHIAALLWPGEPLNDIYRESLLKDSEAEAKEAEKAWSDWLEREFPVIFDGNGDEESQRRANEANEITIRLSCTAEQWAFEKGMQQGAQLMLELLGICRRADMRSASPEKREGGAV